MMNTADSARDFFTAAKLLITFVTAAKLPITMTFVAGTFAAGTAFRA